MSYFNVLEEKTLQLIDRKRLFSIDKLAEVMISSCSSMDHVFEYDDHEAHRWVGVKLIPSWQPALQKGWGLKLEESTR